MPPGALAVRISTIFIPCSGVSYIIIRFPVNTDDFLRTAGVYSSRRRASRQRSCPLGSIQLRYPLKDASESDVGARVHLARRESCSCILKDRKRLRVRGHERERGCLSRVGGTKEILRVFLTALSSPWTVGGVTCSGV